MNKFSEKFKLLYIPFLIISIGFIFLYTGLHWLVVNKWHIAVKTQVADLILPVCLPLIPVFLWYRRRVKAMRFGYNYKEGFVFQVMVWAAVAVPAFFAQLYIEPMYSELGKMAGIPVSPRQYFGEGTNVAAYWAVGTFVAGAWLLLFILFFIRLDEWELMRYRNGYRPSNANETNEILKLFVPNKELFVTPLIADLNILVFAIMVLCGLGFKQFHTADLLAWGGNLRPATMNGEWWRLITCTFLHGGIMHLASNMVGLIFVGALVEPAMGKVKFAITYLLPGIIASIASIYWHPATVSVGASGAIFGLYGAFVALLVTKVFPKDFRRQFLRMTLVFVGYNLAMGFTGNIDNAAHIGGLVSGIIAGIVIAPGLKKAKAEKLRKEHEERNRAQEYPPLY